MGHDKESIKLDQLHDAKPPIRLDGIQNTKTGIGTARDKGTGAIFAPSLLSVPESRLVYLGSDLVQTIVNKPAEEMTRAGFNVRVNDDQEAGEKLTSALMDLKVKKRFMELVMRLRGFGGGIILVNVTDGQTDPSKPIDMDRLESVDSLTVFEPGEAMVYQWGGNPFTGEYGEPASWQISPRLVGKDTPGSGMLSQVHPSRVISVSGPQISRFDLNWKHGFGLSTIDRVWQVVSRFDQMHLSAAALVDDFAQAVFKIRGLFHSMRTNGGQDVRNRLRLMDEYRSVARGIAIDAEGEEFERKSTPVTGLDGLLNIWGDRLAGAAEMPRMVMQGKSPSGLAATGDADVRMWYDGLAKDQGLYIEPGLSYLVKLLCQAKNGPTKGKVPEDWSITFNPLWQPTESEKATTRKTMAETDQIYVIAGVVDVDEVRQSRFGGDEYSIETNLEERDNDDAADDLNDEEGTTTGVDAEGKAIQTKPGQVPGAPGAAAVADTAMNGAQVSSMIEVVTAVVGGKISRKSGKAMLMRAFRVTDAEAEEILGEENFEPEKDELELAKIEAAKNPKPMPGQPGAPVQAPAPKPPVE